MMMLRHLGHGCNINNNLVMIIISSFTLILLLLVGNCPVVVAAGREKLVMELEMMSKSNSRSSSSSSSLSEELVVLEMEGGYGDKKLSTVLVTGTLLCHDNPCNLAPRPLHPVPGASVALACTQSTSSSGGKRTRKKSNWAEGMTDEHGDFLIDLPSHLHALPNLEKTCVVKVVQLPNNSQCHTGFTGKNKGIILSSASNGIRTYTTQNIHMTPPPKFCTRRKEMVYTY